jgi:ATP-dependent DNA helicase RecQ
MEERFGSSVVIDVLKGSNNQRIKNLKFDKLSTYGIMKEYHKDTLKEIIDYLVSDGFINISGDKFPVLNISTTGNAVLRGKLEVFIKKALSKKEEVNNSYEFDAKLFEELKMLRKEIADSLKVPPFIVFSDGTLKDMSVKFPLNKVEMLKVSGVGEFKAERYASKFIEVIQNYIEKNNIDLKNIKIVSETTNNEEEQEKKETNKNNEKNQEKEDTRTVTYKMYEEGKTINEIAEKRNLSTLTIENHLMYCAKLGFQIKYSDFVNDENEELIIEAYKKIGGDKLKPIKEALPDNITYTEIKFALCKYIRKGDTPL